MNLFTNNYENLIVVIFQTRRNNMKLLYLIINFNYKNPITEPQNELIKLILTYADAINQTNYISIIPAHHLGRLFANSIFLIHYESITVYLLIIFYLPQSR